MGLVDLCANPGEEIFLSNLATTIHTQLGHASKAWCSNFLFQIMKEKMLSRDESRESSALNRRLPLVLTYEGFVPSKFGGLRD